MEMTRKDPDQVRDIAVELIHEKVDARVNEYLAQPIFAQQFIQALKGWWIGAKPSKAMVEFQLEYAEVFGDREEMVLLDSLQYGPHLTEARLKVIDVGPATNVSKMDQIIVF
jgi:hypothetical protein